MPGRDPDGATDAIVVGIVVAWFELPAQGSGWIEIALVDATDVTVEALGAPATFESRAERLVVTTSAAPDYRIALPRDATSVEDGSRGYRNG